MLVDGIIDCVVIDYVLYVEYEKCVEFVVVWFGMFGL